MGADAVYPGYGFLSESPDLADECQSAGVTFVGPSASVLRLTGNKMRARQAADEAGQPVLHQSPPIDGPGEAATHAEDIGFPLFVKASSIGYANIGTVEFLVDGPAATCSSR